MSEMVLLCCCQVEDETEMSQALLGQVQFPSVWRIAKPLLVSCYIPLLLGLMTVAVATVHLMHHTPVSSYLLVYMGVLLLIFLWLFTAVVYHVGGLLRLAGDHLCLDEDAVCTDARVLYLLQRVHEGTMQATLYHRSMEASSNPLSFLRDNLRIWRNEKDGMLFMASFTPIAQMTDAPHLQCSLFWLCAKHGGATTGTGVIFNVSATT